MQSAEIHRAFDSSSATLWLIMTAYISTRIGCLVFRSYSHIRMLKAITARRPCRKIPKESIRAPFLQPRVSVPGDGLEDAEVLVLDTAGMLAPPTTTPSAFPPLTAAIKQKKPSDNSMRTRASC